MKIPDIFVPEKNFECNIEKLLKEPQEPIGAQPKYAKFEVIHANTYAEGIAKLKDKNQMPFTFAENVEAHIADYEANGDNAELFKTWLDSVTGIAYKAHSTNFKLILRSDKLENIKPDFNQGFIPIDYNVENGIELDSKKGKYNQLLTREEVKNHEFWLAVMGSDKEKLAEYVDIWFDKTKSEKGMGVYLRSNTDCDELRALVLNGDNSNSDADGSGGLCDIARFVAGAQ
ncbi:MAG: hypothetical protein Q8O03_01710 [Nanoarchaeota archaeon]|nr:hypothetical protein [Nanoarchaeota archaeon]